MKKLFLLLLCFMLIVSGCGAENSNPQDENGNNENISDEVSLEDKTPDGYFLKYSDVIIPLNVPAEDIISKLPAETSYFEAESCAFQGLDKIYTYSGFELHTYEVDGIDYIYGMIFLDDSIETVEGIRLFSTIDDVISVYGNDYEEDMGLYTYTKNKTTLSFLIENDEVVSIEYSAVVE